MTASSDDVQALRDRVAQLEATLATLRSGQLDAILGGAESETLYTHESAERTFRLMVERMADGALTLDREDGQILYCNTAFADLVRMPLGGILGRYLTDFIVAEDRDTAAVILAAEEAARLDVRLLSGGLGVPVSIAATRIESTDGDIVCVTVHDQRAHRIAERLRRKQAALETEAQRKDEFIAMLGHELRNPLAPIQHAAELLATQPDDPSTITRARGTILRQVIHIRRLVDDLLDIARITRGSLPVSLAPIDIRQVVEASLDVARTAYEPGERDLRTDVPTQRVMVEADDVRLTQVLTNLLRNAIKFTGVGDTISVSVTHDDERARIAVEDTGRGIDPSMLPTIFQPFVQEDVRFEGAVGGLGLGLALVKQIVELHHGRVHAESDGKGKGARFVVDLPLASPDAVERADSEPIEVVVPSGPRRVLVCDDNVDAAEMMALLLETSGHEVTTVFTGEDAIETAEERTFDVLFVDIGLPGIDGYEVTRRLRARESSPRMLIVALTGYGQPEDRVAALEAGCDVHLVKPVDRLTVEAALRGEAPK